MYRERDTCVYTCSVFSKPEESTPHAACRVHVSLGYLIISIISSIISSSSSSSMLSICVAMFMVIMCMCMFMCMIMLMFNICVCYYVNCYYY